ncbi:sugar phosphate nucleotidyltransferase [Peptococcaceae bacterium]|nr:sugar phosphate nucleotidyltransferase [Peptococcaceae bacterium]
MRGVILAAGEGTRLRQHFRDFLKPLTPILGLALIERSILSLKECGIKDIVIVTGYAEEKIKAHIGDAKKYGVNISYIYNPDWKLGNATSVYSFHKSCKKDEKFVLMMADHLFDLCIMSDFISNAGKIKDDEVLIAADNRLDEVFHLDECTKISCIEDYAVAFGKKLKQFNAVDCGLFICTKAIFSALSEAISNSLYGLSDALNILAKKRKVRAHFIEGFWVDVDDIESYNYAKKMLLKSAVPDKDGLISKHINRKFSLQLTKLLVNTSITPNQITAISFIIALASAVCFAMLSPALGGILAQLSSIIDGIDGEIARLKFLKSAYGGFIDATLDRYADFAITLGMAYAWYSYDPSTFTLLACAAALTGLPMSMLIKEKFHTMTGKPFIPSSHDGIFRYVPANRDGRLFIIMICGILNLPSIAIILIAVTTHLQALIRLYKARELILKN